MSVIENVEIQYILYRNEVIVEIDREILKCNYFMRNNFIITID